MLILMRHINNSAQKGCGYSLIVNRDFDRAVKILKENGIKIL